MVSIIIPVYNAENNIRRMLNGILRQTYTDYECILVNDGSNDDSEKICQQYETRDHRFHCISQKNSGVSAARNRGIEAANGEYITFLDADDEIPENYIAVLVETCREADISVCDTVIVQDGKEKGRFSHPSAMLNRITALNELLTRTTINSGPCSKLFRRKIIADLRFPMLRTYEDILFVQEAFDRANTVAVTDQTGYFYIQNSEGAMSHLRREPSTDILTASEKLLKFIRSESQLAPECLYTTISHVFQYVLSLSQNDKNYGQNFLKAAQSLYKKYMCDILKCSAIPWKEKVVFFLFAYGWIYDSKKLLRVKTVGA